MLLARRWRRGLDHRLAEVGLTDATWSPLIHLQEMGDGISQKQLAARVGIDGSSLVRLLDILERRGLIERRADPQDGRAKCIFITAAGHAELAGIRQTLSTSEAELLADLSDAQLDAMLQAFALIDQRLTQILDRRG